MELILAQTFIQQLYGFLDFHFAEADRQSEERPRVVLVTVDFQAVKLEIEPSGTKNLRTNCRSEAVSVKWLNMKN